MNIEQKELLDLQPFLQKNWQESGFDQLTPVQKQAMPLILAGKDVVGESPTGTGKTLAYLLPIIERINPERKQAQAIILAPSRELVMQISQEIKKWTKGSKIESAAFIGGANIKKQLEKLKKKPQIVVGTTGRIIELMKLKKLKMHEVKTIVVDEFDIMTSAEHIKEVREIVKATLKDRQILFFSATLSEHTETVAKELMNTDFELVKIDDTLHEGTLQHTFIFSEMRDKIDLLRSLAHMKDIRALVFFNKLEKLSEAEEKLKFRNVELEVLAGESKKVERQHALDRYRSGKVSLLLTTDVAARGLDIQGVTHVIHFDFPSDTKQYIHRSGRTGRMGAEGTVISLVTKREHSFLIKLSEELNIPFAEKVLYAGKLADK